MTNLNFLAGLVILIICGIILAIRLYGNHKDGAKLTMDDFIDLYGDNIIEVLKDVIDILKISMNSYSSQEEYESVVIATTINALKENSVKFGVPSDIVDLFDTDVLTRIIVTVFNKNKCEAMSVLDSKTIKENANIIDNEVFEVLSEAIETNDKAVDIENEESIDTIEDNINNYIEAIKNVKQEAIE